MQLMAGTARLVAHDTRPAVRRAGRFTGPTSRSPWATRLLSALRTLVPQPPGLRDRRLQRRLERGAPLAPAARSRRLRRLRRAHPVRRDAQLRQARPRRARPPTPISTPPPRSTSSSRCPATSSPPRPSPRPSRLAEGENSTAKDAEDLPKDARGSRCESRRREQYSPTTPASQRLSPSRRLLEQLVPSSLPPFRRVLVTGSRTARRAFSATR